MAKVKEIWSVDDESATKRQMRNWNIGCCVAEVMSTEYLPSMEDNFDEGNGDNSLEDE